MVCISSFVARIQLQIFFFTWYNERCLSHCHKISKWYDEPLLLLSIDIELKYAILQWTNKDPAIIFTCMRERHPWQCQDE